MRAVRIGHEDDDRIAQKTKSLLLQNQIPDLKKRAINQGKEFLEKWAVDNGVHITNVRMAMALERRAQLQEHFKAVEARIKELRPILSKEKRTGLEPEERADLDQELSERMKEQEGLLRDLKESLGEVRKWETDKDTLEHLVQCTPGELRDWANTYNPPGASHAASLKQLLAAHVEWETRFGRSREFKAALVASSQL